MKKVAIVIPFYKSVLSPEEEISVRHLNHYLKKYDKYLILPRHLKKISFKIPSAKILYFPSQYFTKIEKYSQMANSKVLYETFVDYDYMLVYQLDALVFSDQLLSWCKKGYDYIGAPLFNSKIGFLTSLNYLPISGCNGGLSLRRVSKFLKVIKMTEKKAKRFSDNTKITKLWFLLAILTGKSHQKWLDAPASCYPFNEDGFWSYEAPKYYPKFKVAPFKEALKFSFEKLPRKCFALNHSKLPFGAHAWEKYDPSFWKPFLKN